MGRPRKVKRPPQKKPPSIWDQVRTSGGKLKGMLTDDLMNGIFTFTEGLPKSGVSGHASLTPVRVGNRVNRRMPSKFK